MMIKTSKIVKTACRVRWEWIAKVGEVRMNDEE